MAAAKKSVQYRVVKDCYWSPPGERSLHRTPTKRSIVMCPEFGTEKRKDKDGNEYVHDLTPSFLEKVVAKKGEE